MREDIAEARHDILKRFAAAVPVACDEIIGSLTVVGKAARRTGARGTNARYILDTLLDRAPSRKDIGPSSFETCPVDELAKRREALMRVTRELRKDTNE